MYSPYRTRSIKISSAIGKGLVWFSVVSMFAGGLPIRKPMLWNLCFCRQGMTRESILPPVQSLLKRFSNLANNFRGSYCHIQSFLCWRWSQYFQPYSCTNKPFASHRYCWWLGRAENSLFFRQQSGGYCVFSCIFLHACHVSGWRENVHPTTFFLIFSLAIRGVWGVGQ